MNWVIRNGDEESLDKMHPHYVVVLLTDQEHHFCLKKKKQPIELFKNISIKILG